MSKASTQDALTRNEVLAIRLNRHERELVDRAAMLSYERPSTWVRQRIMREAKKVIMAHNEEASA